MSEGGLTRPKEEEMHADTHRDPIACVTDLAECLPRQRDRLVGAISSMQNDCADCAREHVEVVHLCVLSEESAAE